VLQCVASHRHSRSRSVATHQVCCSVLQYVAGFCSVLQHVAVCCSVLQCVAEANLIYTHKILAPICVGCREEVREESLDEAVTEYYIC